MTQVSRARARTRATVASTTTLALGVASALGAALPASATTGPAGEPACDVIQDLINDPDDFTTSLDFSRDFVLSCVPQYGLGKVEFTIDSDQDLPEGFSLEDALASQSTNDFDIADVEAYYGDDFISDSGFYPGAFQLVERSDDGSDPTSSTWQAILILPLESVEVVPLGDLPAQCTGTFTHAFRLTAESRTTTLSAQTGSTVWTVPITVNPVPITWAVNVDATDPLNPTTTGDACIVAGDEAFFVDALGDVDDVQLFTFLFLGLGIFTADSLGSFAPSDAFVSLTPIELNVSFSSVPTLPQTGFDATDTVATAGVALTFALVGGVLVMRRRRRHATRDA